MILVRHLANTGHRPAIGMMPGVAHFADLYAARITGQYRLQAIRAAVFHRPAELDSAALSADAHR
jgi:hypothetical protein